MVVVEGREESRCDRADDRIEVIDGLTSSARRKEIEGRFNTDPSKDALRILLATDATRERLNFQAHCAELFDFDLSWIPGRIEQPNGRIDRKQPVPEVTRHYFVLPQRVEDRVIDVGQEMETIERRLAQGIRHRDAERRLDHRSVSRVLKKPDHLEIGGHCAAP